VHGDSFDPEPLAGSHDPARDLAPIGDKDGVEHAGSFRSRRLSSGDTIEVVLAVVALLVAVVAGWLSGGSLERLGSLALRSRRLVWGALAAQLGGTLIGGPLYPIGLVVSVVLVGGFLHRNRGIRGTGLVGLGLLCNAIVVGLNGAMPVSLDAAGRAGTTTQHILVGDDERHELAGRHTHLRWLGDIVPVRTPWRPEVVSPGDILVAAGLAQLVLVGMRTGRRRSGKHARGRTRGDTRDQEPAGAVLVGAPGRV
jgi:hypothetical protein